MVAPIRPHLSAFPSSLYAAELQSGAASRSFSAEFETQYVRAQLLGNRTLIRVACVFAALVAAIRGAEQYYSGLWHAWQLIALPVVLIASTALAVVAWSRAFERFYTPLAQIVVPARNVVVTIFVAGAAAHGQGELLMFLPLMIVGPFFFLGLRFRVALLTVLLTIVSFIAAASIFGLALPVALRTTVLIVIAAVGCAIGARHLEKSSRRGFLESHLIAEIAQHDALTGLKNRRVFDEHLARLWDQAVADTHAIAILLIDVDHFKAFNDRYGHQAGDQTLRRVAQTLQAFVTRPLDVLARYGGEEFAVILDDISADEAQALAERMRRAVSELPIEHQGSRVGPALTISIGVAVIEPSLERRARGALQLADQALYEAKVRGRNRVELMDHDAHRLLETGVFSRSSFAGGR